MSLIVGGLLPLGTLCAVLAICWTMALRDNRVLREKSAEVIRRESGIGGLGHVFAALGPDDGVIVEPVLIATSDLDRISGSLSSFEALRSIILVDQSIGPEAEVLTRLPNLRFLSIQNCQVESFSFVQDLRQLEKLVIVASGAADGDLQELQLPGHTTSLDLSFNSGITSRGLASLDLSTVQTLCLDSTSVSDLEFLRCAPLLERLELANTSIDDDDLHALSALANLTDIVLAGTVVSDHGIGILAEHPALNDVDLSHTQTTAEGRLQLREAIMSRGP